MDSDRFRSALERLVERPLLDTLKGSRKPGFLASQLLEEVMESARADVQGKVYAPDQYTLSLHPDDVEAIRLRAAKLQTELSEGINESLREAGLSIARDAHLALASDPTLGRDEARIIAWHSSDPLQVGEGSLETKAGAPEPGEPSPRGAFLMVEGREHFQLVSAALTIGRLPDNDLVLADGHVSRRHAQIRASEGRFTIKDLESTSGMLVNGRRVREHRLKPGDVILLGETELIYGEDPAGPPDVAPPYKPREPGGRVIDQETPLDLKRLVTEKLQRRKRK